MYFRPVLIEVPHFASLRDKEREIQILRSDNGDTWYEHPMIATEDAVAQAMAGTFEGGKPIDSMLSEPVLCFSWGKQIPFLSLSDVCSLAVEN